MLKIAVTGTIGSGKSTVSRIIESRGYPVAYSDSLAATAKKNLKINILSLFQGWNIETEQGELDNQKIASVIFNNPLKRKAFESILHPEVKKLRQVFFSQALRSGSPAAFYESAIIFEVGIEHEFDRVICVASGDDVRKQRLVSQRGYTENEITERNLSQFSESKKIALSDATIWNGGSIDDLTTNVDSFLKDMLAGQVMVKNRNTTLKDYIPLRPDTYADESVVKALVTKSVYSTYLLKLFTKLFFARKRL